MKRKFVQVQDIFIAVFIFLYRGKKKYQEVSRVNLVSTRSFFNLHIVIVSK